MLAIFIVSGQSQPPLPEGMSNATGHVLAYAVLGLLVLRALAGGLPARVTRRIAVTTLAIVIAYGISDELHQMFVPGRTADILDVMADAAGGLISIVACGAWGIIRVPYPGSDGSAR